MNMYVIHINIYTSVDGRCSTSLWLPEMVALRQKGYSCSKIAKELALSKRQVEHALRRHAGH